MIRMLSDMGRVLVVVGAFLTIASFTVGGYFFARAAEATMYGTFSISGGGQITPLEISYSLAGLGVGFVVAGAVFGAIATLYDIRDIMRQLALERSLNEEMTSHLRREPRFG